MVCQLAGVPNDILQERGMTAGEAGAMLRAQRELDALPIKLIDAVGMSGPAIGLRVRAMNARRRVRLVVADHVQKIVAARDGKDTETTATQKASSALKDLARKVGAPVLALWQLSRDVDKRDDPRPRLSDLLYGGETDADVAAFLFRQERYLKKRAPEKFAKESDEQHDKRVRAWRQQCDEAQGRAELIVAKRRQGPEGFRTLRFDGPTTTFSEIGAAPVDDLPTNWGDGYGPA
jgi:replicative DNA helicase